jgi:hypothetical protein
VLETLDAPDFVAATATCSRKRPIRIETSLRIACTDEHFQLSSLVVRFDNAIKPLGWFYPTDTAGPFKGLELGVALDKPWYSGFVAAAVKVVAPATCIYRPG